jgi:proteic killer suppression protein
MEIEFEKEYLRELYHKGKSSEKRYRFQPQVVKGYIKALNIMDSVERIEDLFRYKSLHYEKLHGDKEGLESVRANDQYRIEFRSTVNGEITICNIIELSNHYK